MEMTHLTGLPPIFPEPTFPEPIFPDFTRNFTVSATVMWVILSKMDEINNNIDPENQVSYGRSTRGNEVMIVNDREIFHLCYFHVGQAIQRWVSHHG